MNQTLTSYSSGRIVPGVLALEATMPLSGIREAGRLWESAAALCEKHGINTTGPTSEWLPRLVEAEPDFNTAVSWVEGGLHEGFHLYQLLSTNYGRVRVATEYEILSIKAHTYDSMLRNGFRFAHPDDGGINLSKMLLASPNSQFEIAGDMLSTFEEMQEYADNFTDERLESLGFTGDNAIRSNTLEEEAASFFALFSTQGGDFVKTVGKNQRNASGKYSSAMTCFNESMKPLKQDGHSNAFVLFVMIHLSFRYGSYTPEDGDHPVSIFATLIGLMPDINDLTNSLLAEHTARIDTPPSKSLSDILGINKSKVTDVPYNAILNNKEREAAEFEMARLNLTTYQCSVLDLFAKLCSEIASLIEDNCNFLNKRDREANDLLPRKPLFIGVWNDFNKEFPAWIVDWEIALSLISPFGTEESGFMFWSTMHKVVSFGSDRLDIGGVKQAYLALDRLERLFQGKPVRISVDQSQIEGKVGFEKHTDTPSTAVGSINALLEEYSRDIQDVVFDPYSPGKDIYEKLPGGFYIPKSLMH